MIRVSSAILTLLSSTVVVVLSPFGVRTTFVGHVGLLCLRGPSIRFAFALVLLARLLATCIEAVSVGFFPMESFELGKVRIFVNEVISVFRHGILMRLG